MTHRDRIQTARPALRLLGATSDRDRGDGLVFDHRTPEQASPGGCSIRVLVAGVEAVVRAGYRALLESEDRITVVGDVGSAAEAIELASETRPDVLVLDLALPGLEDPESTAQTISRAVSAGVALMLIAQSENDERVFSALRAGADGVLAKNIEPAALIQGVYSLARGEAVISVGAVRRLLREVPSQWRHHGPRAEQLEELTDRERVVVALVAMGLNNTEIAEELVISPRTAKTHVSHAMLKLSARHRAQLVVMAYESGLVQPSASAPSARDIPTATAQPLERTAINY